MIRPAGPLTSSTQTIRLVILNTFLGMSRTILTFQRPSGIYAAMQEKGPPAAFISTYLWIMSLLNWLTASINIMMHFCSHCLIRWFHLNEGKQCFFYHCDIIRIFTSVHSFSRSVWIWIYLTIGSVLTSKHDALTNKNKPTQCCQQCLQAQVLPEH